VRQEPNGRGFWVNETLTPRVPLGFSLTPSRIPALVVKGMKASSLNDACGGPDPVEGCAEGLGIQMPGAAGAYPMGRGGGGGVRALPRGVSKAPAGRLAGTDGAEKDGTEETDEALIARMRDGDSGALAELWTRYTGLLYTQAHAILHNPVDSEEVVAEMFVEVWQRADLVVVAEVVLKCDSVPRLSRTSQSNDEILS
jgi:hypothetical protein